MSFGQWRLSMRCGSASDGVSPAGSRVFFCLLPLSLPVSLSLCLIYFANLEREACFPLSYGAMAWVASSASCRGRDRCRQGGESGHHSWLASGGGALANQSRVESRCSPCTLATSASNPATSALAEGCGCGGPGVWMMTPFFFFLRGTLADLEIAHGCPLGSRTRAHFHVYEICCCLVSMDATPSSRNASFLPRVGSTVIRSTRHLRGRAPGPRSVPSSAPPTLPPPPPSVGRTPSTL